MNLTFARHLIPAMLLGLFFLHPSANAQTHATSPNLEPSVDRTGEFTRMFSPLRHRLADRLISPAAPEQTKQSASVGMTLSTLPGGIPQSSAASNETYFVFDESYLDAVATQYDASGGVQPGSEEWQTVLVTRFDRTESGRLERITDSGREQMSETEWMDYSEIYDYEYDALDRLERVIDRYEITFNGQNESSTYAIYEYDYDESGRISEYREIWMDDEEGVPSDTTIYTFTYGEDAISIAGVNTESVGDTLRATAIEGENLTLLIEDPYEGVVIRETTYGVPDVLTYFMMSEMSFFLDYLAVLEEEYDESSDAFIPYSRVRHEVSEDLVTVFMEDYDPASAMWESYEKLDIQLDPGGLPVQAQATYIYGEDTYLGERMLFNPDPEFLQFTSLEDGLAGVPTVYELAQNYPNPFNPSTEIAFKLNQPGAVSLRVYDAVGREVAVLVDSPLASGRHSVTFDATGLPSGVYYYRLAQAGSGAPGLTRSMVLLK